MSEPLNSETFLLWAHVEITLNFTICLSWFVVYLISFGVVNKCHFNNNTQQDSNNDSDGSKKKKSNKKRNSRKRNRARDKQDVDVYTKYVTIIFPFCYVVGYFWWLLNWMLDYPSNIHWVNFIWFMVDTAFVCSLLCFNLLMVLRLYKSFKDTSFALSKLSLILISVFLLFIIIVDILVLHIYQWGTHINNVLYMVFVISNLIFGLLLVCLFCYKLCQLALLQRRSTLGAMGMHMSSINSGTSALSSNTSSNPGSPTIGSVNSVGSMSSGANSDNESSAVETSETSSRVTFSRQLSQRQMQLVDVATKYSLLCSIAIIFNNLQFFCYVLFYIEYGLAENILQLCLLFWYDIVVFVNFYCIWLSFAFAKKNYQTTCKKSHRCCKSICTFIVNKMIEFEMES